MRRPRRILAPAVAAHVLAAGGPSSRRTAGLVVVLGAFALLVVGCSRPAPVVDDDLVPATFASTAGVRRWSLVDGWRMAPTLHAPSGASRVAFLADVEPGATLRLQARAVDDDGVPTTEWAPAQVTWRDLVGDDAHYVARVDLGAIVTAVQFRVHDDDVARLRSLTAEAVVPAPPPPAGVVASAPAAVRQGVLDGYEPRSAWGARAPSLHQQSDEDEGDRAPHRVAPERRRHTR
jgi:hypothetical protein